MRVHAVILALNEEPFIENQLQTLYPFCSGLSVVTQYDRDWYGNAIEPDRTAELVLKYPDPEGKIQLVVRRFPDEAAARNCEMLSLMSRPDRGVMSHGVPLERILEFHRIPEYFLIVDADEFYDPVTFPGILEYLKRKRPRGMRVNGYNYVRTWNRRIPSEVVQFCHFGFVKPGVLFKMRRTVSWNESRFSKLLQMLHAPDISAQMWGFIECPWSIGFFHHGCWLGNEERLLEKARRSSHADMAQDNFPQRVRDIPFTFVPTEDLPVNLRQENWPAEFHEATRAPDIAPAQKVIRG
jgi:hypothetical protein